MKVTDVLKLGGEEIGLGERRDLDLHVTESYSGTPVTLPVRVWRGRKLGPTVLVIGALHGDELNGTGIVRSLILNPPFELEAGSLILVPVVNLPGLERHSRYLPDRRDLNRCFPGDAQGSASRRLAHTLFHSLVDPADYCIDLHSAAVRRTNFANVRADLSLPEVRRIAEAFGCSLVVNGKGPEGSLRRAACAGGCPTIVLEAGEVWKIEATVTEVGLRGIRNVLIELGSVSGTPHRPVYQARVDRTKWVRAQHGGMLHFHVVPGDIVKKGQPLATNTNLLGVEQDLLESPLNAVVLGMTTLPFVAPGSPVCHLAVPRGGIGTIRRAEAKLSGESLHERLRDDLATSLTVAEVESQAQG